MRTAIQNHYLITPNALLKHFACESDRERFSRPVAVMPLYCEIATRFIFVRDGLDRTFPVRRAHLTTHLTRAQQRRMEAK